MKKGLFCFILSLLFFQLYSQLDYRPGYIILNSGDSINGLIDFRNDFSNSHHIYFKNDTNSIIKEYFPNQLKAYHFINSKYYVSKKINLNNDEKIVFLEFLLLGKVNILYGILEDKNRKLSRKGQYFIEKEGKLVEINNNIITGTNSTGNAIVRNSNQYKGVLKSFFIDCPTIYKEVDNVEFNQKSLINISKNYHEKMCPDIECIIFEKPISRRKYCFGIEYNSIFPRLSLFSSESLVISNASPENKFSIGVLGATNFDSDYRLWFQINLKYQHQNYSDSSNYKNIYPSMTTYEFNSIFMDLSLKYKFFLTKLKPYIIGGLTVGYITEENYKMISSIHGGPTFADNESTIYGLKAGTGIEYSISSRLNIYFSVDYIYNTTFSKMMIHGYALNGGLYFLI